MQQTGAFREGCARLFAVVPVLAPCGGSGEHYWFKRGIVVELRKHHLIKRTTYSSERTDAADTARTRAEPL